MHDVYADFAENYMAMPVIKGAKVAHERFPGALDTYTIEAMMQDGKALQAGTSHFLGQNFSKALDISFQDEKGDEVHAWTTSWGVSTRLIGGMIMTHSDDDGLVLPPKLAPKHVVIMPIFRKEEDKERVLEYCMKLQKELTGLRYHDEKLRVHVDARDIRGGEKAWSYIKKGVPIRLEVGPRDMDKDSVFMGRRDLSPKDKTSLSREEFMENVLSILDEIQGTLYQRALAYRDEKTKKIDSLDELKAFFTPKNKDKPEIHGGFALVHCDDDPSIEAELKKLKITHRCMPLDGEMEDGNCVFTGKPMKQRAILAKAY